MPGYTFGLPVGATLARVLYDGKTYPVDNDHLISRTGEDGAVKVLILDAGDKFGGQFLQGWEVSGAGNVSRRGMKVDGSGVLQYELVTTGAGTTAETQIGRRIPLALLKSMELTVEMELPASDAGAPGSDPFMARFMVTDAQWAGDPQGQSNHFELLAEVTEDGLLYTLKQRTDGAGLSTLWDGSTYAGNSVRDEAANPISQWRFVFSDKPGVASAVLTVYVKMAANRGALAAATENQLTDGSTALTFDISEWTMIMGFYGFKLESDNPTYFNAANPFYSTGVEVSYPDGFKVRADTVAAASMALGRVAIYDEDGIGGTTKGSWRLVTKPDSHVFAGNVVMDNTLVRVEVDPDATYGFKFYGYIGGAWVQPNGQIYTRFDSANIRYCSFVKWVTVGPQATTMRVRFHYPATEEANRWMDVDVTMRRGSYVIELDIVDIYPLEDAVIRWENTGTKHRFGYLGSGDVGQDDNGDSGTNATPPDGILMSFDQDVGNYMLIMALLQDPVGGTSRTEANDGGDLEIDSIAYEDVKSETLYLAILPYSNDSFAESEDEGTEGTPTSSTEASGKATPLGATNILSLDALADKAYWSRTAGTNLDAGLYAMIYHLINYVATNEDAYIYLYNQTDSKYRTQSGEKDAKSLSNSWAYFESLVYVERADVTGGNEMRAYAEKQDNDADVIAVDSVLLIPLSDGESWPMDIINNALYTRELYRNIIRI